MAYSAIVSGMAPLGFPPFLPSSRRTDAVPHVVRSTGEDSPQPSGTLALHHPPARRLAPHQLRGQPHPLDRPRSPAPRRFALALLFLAVALTIQAIAALATRAARSLPTLHPLRHIPRFPGRTGGLIRHNLRQLASVLDFYAALVIAISAAVYRWFDPKADPVGFAPLAVLIALVLSTVAQSSFGLESDSGLTRYALLPLQGWQVLLSKDAAFLIVTLTLILPLWDIHAAGAGLTFTFIAITLGRYPSLYATPLALLLRRLPCLRRPYGLRHNNNLRPNPHHPITPPGNLHRVSDLAAGARYWDKLHRPTPRK